MNYSCSIFEFVCDCGKEFYIAKQDWGKVDYGNIGETIYKCLKCTNNETDNEKYYNSFTRRKKGEEADEK